MSKLNIKFQSLEKSEARRRARRQLVVLLSMIIFVLLPLVPTIYTVAYITIWLHIPNKINLLEALFVIISLLFFYFIFTLISAIIWEFIMSFYVSQDEWNEFIKGDGLFIPVLTPAFQKIEQLMLHWKLHRENKEQKTPLKPVE